MTDTHAVANLLRDGVVMLGAALVFVLLFRRLGLGATLGYLVAGALIGPQALALVGGAEAKMGIAELGITLLLFLVGLELAPARLWRLRRDIFGLGLAQVLACGAALVGMLFAFTGFSGPAAIVLGLPLALSSTAQVLPMLQSAGRLNTPFGERTFSILLLQDLSIVPLITIVAALSRAPADPAAPPGWLLAVYTVAAVAGLVLAGRYLLRPLFRLIGNLGERELFIAAALFTVLAAAAVMELLHLSTALGAFVAGVMLADSPYRHEIEADVDPFRTILLGMFFVTVGMMLDLHVIAARPALIVALAVAVVATKALVLWAIAFLFGMPRRPALALGLLLSQGGEFGFVLFAQAEAARLIAPQAASIFGAVVTLSMVTTPFLMALSQRFNRAGAGPERDDLEAPSAAMPASVIVVGYGRFGQTVTQMLLAKSVSVTIIDIDAEQIDMAGTFDTKVYYGDGTRIDLLRQAGAAEARAIVFAMDGDALDKDMLKPIGEAFRQAALLVRAFDRRHMMRLSGVELAATVREVFESAVYLGRETLAAIGTEAAEVDRVEEEYRERDRLRLEKQSRSGDLRAARHLVFTQEHPMDENGIPKGPPEPGIAGGRAEA